MPRTTLKTLIAGFGALLLWGWACASDRHVDLSFLPRGCASCHQGHGESGSPMLPSDQKQLCLRCHTTEANVLTMVQAGILSQDADPPLLQAQFLKGFVHPISDGAFSANEPNAVTCTSCHSAHRSPVFSRQAPGLTAGRKLSPRGEGALEYDLCESCHGSQGAATTDVLDISRLFDPNNRSYHPVKAPAGSSSPSVADSIAGREINCTDCHGSDDLAGPSGLHGSNVRFLLVRSYESLDGTAESLEAYALCYSCHDRQMILDSPTFPLHRLHVEDRQASCSTCHDPHGSPDQRSLMRISQDARRSEITPSASTGILAFESEFEGTGLCYLTCHGVDHAPEAYGPGSETLALEFEIPQASEADRFIPSSPPGRAPRPGRKSRLDSD
ncbi:MAG: hypothetical protein IFK94_07230 [Acidobacteria bacterium]|uniref:Doubled CXXCH motif domain-containing protein n=1 Tax=Candidatus Polarisedimenticola svalbardensis TaxID=2886004 RepID=A0A8J6Y0E5_9BACT|nr:hypothetical protein [Candidatus Polarisedimenticola svalbardensis]